MIVWHLLGCAAPVGELPPTSETVPGSETAETPECDSLWAAFMAFRHGVQCNEPTGVDPVDPTYGCPADQPVNDCARDRFESPRVGAFPTDATHERIYLPACPDPDGCTEAELARCTDGTRPAVNLGRAPEGSPDARRWVVHFQGAGRPCGGEESCLSIYRFGPGSNNAAALSSSHAGLDTWPDHKEQFGILAAGENSAFSEFNRVAFDRCVTANQHTDGRVFAPILESRTPPGATVEVFYRARPIFRALLQRLLQEGFADAEQVVLTGGSDGARALVHMADWFADEVRAVAPNAEVMAVFDSNFRPMMGTEAQLALETCGDGGDGVTFWNADYFNADGLEVACEDPARRHPFSPANFSPRGPNGGPGVIHQEFEMFRLLEDESCLDAYADHPEPGVFCRNMMHVMTHHVETPFFVMGRLADVQMRAGEWLELEDETVPFFTEAETEWRLRKQAIDLVEGWALESREPRTSGVRPPGVLLTQGDEHTFLLKGTLHLSQMSDCGEAEVYTVGEALRRWVAGGPVVSIDGYRDVFADALECF